MAVFLQVMGIRQRARSALGRWERRHATAS